MIVGANKLEIYIKNGIICEDNYKPLVENIPEDFEIEGTTVDLSLDKLFLKTPYKSILLTKERRFTGSIEEEPVNNFNRFCLKSKSYYIGVTKEIINMPLWMIAKPISRMTNISSGLIVSCGVVQPNFFGPLKFGIYNTNEIPVEIERGFRIITVSFEAIVGKVNIYNGFHQGGDKINFNNAPSR